jgi:hypothetical protein
MSFLEKPDMQRGVMALCIADSAPEGLTRRNFVAGVAAAAHQEYFKKWGLDTPG